MSPAPGNDMPDETGRLVAGIDVDASYSCVRTTQNIFISAERDTYSSENTYQIFSPTPGCRVIQLHLQ